MKPQKGLLTFMAEGNNSPTSQYYSRKLHWPGISLKCSIYRSGVTLGRGYDMKYRTVNEIVNDLTYSFIPIDKARAIAQGSKNTLVLREISSLKIGKKLLISRKSSSLIYLI